MLYSLMIVGTVDKGDSLLIRVEKVVKETDASGLKVERLGKKTLAYKIKKQTDANYYLLNFEASGSSIKTITDKLRLEQDDLLRYLLLKKIEKKSRGKNKKVVAVLEKESEKEKPKVTVAVKKPTAVKSTKVKSTKRTKGKSK